MPIYDLLLLLLCLFVYSFFILCLSVWLCIQDRAEGMIVLIQHGQAHVVHQKRAYLFIKFIVNLCSRLGVWSNYEYM